MKKTVFQLVEELKVTQNGYDQFFQIMHNFDSNVQPSCVNYKSYYALRCAVMGGFVDYTKELLNFLVPQFAVAKRALKIFNKYKGEKILISWSGNTSEIISFDDRGRLVFPKLLYENFLQVARLIEHAEIRCKKHPKHRTL